MMTKHICPCCSYPLVCQVRLGKPYWFCRHCYQEMPFGETLPAHETGFPYGLKTQITERKWTQEAVWESRELSHWINETTIEGIWVVDPLGKTAFVNPRMAAMLGYPVEQIQGQPIFAFMDEECQAIAIANLERRRQGVEEQLDYKLRCQDGSALWTTVLTHPLFDEAGQYAGALGIVIDITVRKRREEALQQRVDELEQANRRKDESLAIAYHELRLPVPPS